MKLFFVAIIAACTMAATRLDVVPVNWAGIKSSAPTDSLSLITKKLMNNSIKYFISHYLETLPDSAGLFRLSAYTDSNHSKIREPATGSELIGTALATGSYDSLIVGKGMNEIVSTEVKLIKSLTTVYWGNGGTFLGGWNCWQCALWAAQCGLGAWLVWDKLDTLTQTQIARMLEKEANKLNYEPLYCNDCTDDTKAEENAWMAMAMTLSIAMMPNHPNVSTWKTRASQWMLSAFARESDLRRNVLVDGKLPRDWIRGWNMNENGYVYNHGFTHPDYMCTITLNIYSSLYQSLAGQTISQAAIYNFDEVFNCFVNYRFPVPPFKSPGGTIYQTGKANVYYPSGTDWSSARIDLHLQLPAFASLFPDVAKRSAVHPDAWAKIRADTIEWRMKRFTTGQQYAPGEWDYAGQSPWMLAEVMGGAMFSSTYLSRWLKSSGAFSKVGNWHLSTPDTTPPSQPTSFTANTVDMSTISLRWNLAADIGSGIAYYLLSRDGKEVALTKDTSFTDYNLPSGSAYTYSLLSIDYNNNRSVVAASASASTPADTVSMLPVKVSVVDSSTLLIAFSRNPDSSAASLLSNYTAEGFTINSVATVKSGNEVILKVSPLTAGTSYAVSVNFGSGSTRLSFKCPLIIGGLIGYWPCDEKSGNIIYDKSPMANNAFFSGSVARIKGYSAGGISFDSLRKSHALFLAAPRNVRCDFPFTIALWIKTAATNKAQTILSTEDYYGRYYGAWIDINATGQISAGIGNGFSPSPDARKNKTTASSITAGRWNHIAAVIKNSSDMTVYINGADAGGSYSGTATSIAHNEYGEFKLGRRIASGNVEQNFEGAVDEIKIFKTALTAAQVQELANDTGSTVQTEKEGIPGRFSFSHSPNPFNPQCRFSLVLQDANIVSLEITDIRGSLISRIVSGRLPAGKHSMVWNARNGKGENISAGLYIVRLKVGNDIIRTNRIVLSK